MSTRCPDGGGGGRRVDVAAHRFIEKVPSENEKLALTLEGQQDQAALPIFVTKPNQTGDTP